MKFLLLKKRNIIISFVLILIFLACIFLPTVLVTSPRGKATIIVDAGHGGIDGGSVGISGTTERVINLEYAKTLKRYLEDYGFHVILTRENLDGLASPNSENVKKSDMLKRKEIIEKNNADLVVSIHMNSFPLESCRGAQVFYNPNSEISMILASSIQDVFIKNLPKARAAADKGDYYLLNCTNVPAVIVECGFISNAEEEKLLLTEEYREKVCYSILCGIIKYYGAGELN